MEPNYLIDKSWMYKYKTKHERVNPHFLAGVQHFMEFAEKSINSDGSMKCPCTKCENKFNQEKDTVHFHIIREGFTQRYTAWYFHGESRKRHRVDNNAPSGSASDMAAMFNDATQHRSAHAAAITKAEEVLESTPADPTREAKRHIHISNEVLEAYYEEMDENSFDHAPTLETSISTLRKTRGPTQETAVTPPKGKKWKCLFIDGQPVGKAASKLAIILGLYARMDRCFLPHKQWKEQSKQSFNDVMKDIMRDYDFADHEGMPVNMMVVTHFCEASLSKKLREWRWWLKSHYYIEDVPNEVLMKTPDKRITRENWELLLKYWESDKKVVEAKRNKKNRGEDQPTHTLGAKSIARHNQDWREKLGANYTTLGAYIKAHQTKSGKYPDEYTRVICEKVMATCAEKDLTNSSDPCILSPILDAVYKGHHGGYERGRGLGWTREASRSRMEIQASNDHVRHLTSELQSTQSELQNAKAEIEALHARERKRGADNGSNGG